MFTHDDGTPMTFAQAVVAILVEEHGRMEEEAVRLVGRFPDAMVNGIVAGNPYRATAMALEMLETEAKPLPHG